MIEPRSGLSRPTSVLRKTDLPVPEGPSITEISPAGRVSETSCQMTWRPKDFVSPSTWISTPTRCAPHRSAVGLPTGNEHPPAGLRLEAHYPCAARTGRRAGGTGRTSGDMPPGHRGQTWGKSFRGHEQASTGDRPGGFTAGF